jgi:hypothetical protein
VEGQHPYLLPACIELTPIALYSAFVPSEKNALKDILLARTVSGESPSKIATKSPHRHRSRSASPSKIKRNKTATKAQGGPIKGKGSRLKLDTTAPTGSVSGNAATGAYHYFTQHHWSTIVQVPLLSLEAKSRPRRKRKKQVLLLERVKERPKLLTVSISPVLLRLFSILIVR